MKPDMKEQVGRAVGASVLLIEETHEGALDKVAALGLAQLRRGKLEIDSPMELAALLLRLKVGNDPTARKSAALLLFRMLMRQSKRHMGWFGSSGRTLMGFSVRCVDEFMSDICPPPCGGRGFVDVDSDGNKRSQRVCPICNGIGRRPMEDEAGRAKALAIGLPAYRAIWRRRFLQIGGMLARIDRQLVARLHSELGRNTLRGR